MRVHHRARGRSASTRRPSPDRKSTKPTRAQLAIVASPGPEKETRPTGAELTRWREFSHLLHVIGEHAAEVALQQFYSAANRLSGLISAPWNGERIRDFIEHELFAATHDLEHEARVASALVSMLRREIVHAHYEGRLAAEAGGR
jgi:hypothetical protein